MSVWTGKSVCFDGGLQRDERVKSRHSQVEDAAYEGPARRGVSSLRQPDVAGRARRLNYPPSGAELI